jgi:hypothetical protein
MQQSLRWAEEGAENRAARMIVGASRRPTWDEGFRDSTGKQSYNSKETCHGFSSLLRMLVARRSKVERNALVTVEVGLISGRQATRLGQLGTSAYKTGDAVF